MVGADRAGFTLVEAIVALALSSVLVVLVGTTFLIQNRYYATQVERSAAQDNARMVTEMIAREIRSIGIAGVVQADNKTLVVRSPMSLAVICAQAAHDAFVHMEDGVATLDTLEVTGVAVRDTTTTGWTYYTTPWNGFTRWDRTPAASCAANGADTAGATAEYLAFRRLNTFFGYDPPAGSILMVFRQVKYTFATSTMDPTTVALYRTVGTGSAVEFATGMDASAQFKYRTGGSSYATSVGIGNLATIDAIRIEAQARRSPQTGGVDDVTFGWGVNVMLRNGG